MKEEFLKVYLELRLALEKSTMWEGSNLEEIKEKLATLEEARQRFESKLGK